MNDMTLILPAEEKWSLALRTSLSAAGAIANLSLDVIDDLLIAVDEAFDLLTNQPRKLSQVKLTCSIKESVMKVRLDGIRTENSQHCLPLDPETAKLIIGTLATDVHLESDMCGIHSVCMSLPTVDITA